MKAKHRNENGFTLIEALVALAIFSIGILAVASMQINALGKNTSARKTTEAIEIAIHQAEFLRGLPFYPRYNESGIADANDRFTNQPVELAAGVFTDPDPDHTGRYTLQWTVQDDIPLLAIDHRIGVDDVTVSKTIFIEVAEVQTGRTLAEMEIVKIWEQD